MILKFCIECKLCGNRKDRDFYIMPKEEKTKSGDIIHSTSIFKIVCKRCGKVHKLTLKVTG